jgi:hypothetical protein
MEVLNLAIIFELGESYLAQDLFSASGSGKNKSTFVPYPIPLDLKEFLVVARGARPQTAIAKASRLSQLSMGDLRNHASALGLRDYYPIIKRELETDRDEKRIATVIEVESVEILPMEMAELIHSSYLRGDLREERDTEGMARPGH